MYLECQETSLIVDTSPDLRQQVLACGIKKVDGFFYTHSHADHINGIDDVKSFNFMSLKPLPAYGDQFTIDYLKKAFPYVFADNIDGKGWYKPWLLANYVKFYDDFRFGSIEVKTMETLHGKMPVVGYIFNDVAYTTDTNYLPPKSLDMLKGIKLWVVDCLRYSESEGHANFDQVMEWIKIVKPERAILTHMAHDIEYEDIKKKLPANILPAYDGMIVEV
jgi:phosphoribosyl 1,2-cyclic phosphate phosphodiesterase